MENGYRSRHFNWDICFDANLKLSKVAKKHTPLVWYSSGQNHDWLWRKCFRTTYPESSFLDWEIEYKKYNYINKVK
jgi:hypothetical protein